MTKFNTRQVASILDINVRTVRKLIKEGKLNATIRSKREGYLVTRLDLEEFARVTPGFYNRYVAMRIQTAKAVIWYHLQKYPELSVEDLLELKKNVDENAAQRIGKEEP